MDIQTIDRAPSSKLPNLVRNAIRMRHDSLRTEESHVYWIRGFVRFSRLRHPRGMGTRKATAFLTRLAGKFDVAAATQQQALAAILCLYKQVLELERPGIDGIERAKRPKRRPAVRTRSQTEHPFAPMEGTHKARTRWRRSCATAS